MFCTGISDVPLNIKLMTAIFQILKDKEGCYVYIRAFLTVYNILEYSKLEWWIVSMTSHHMTSHKVRPKLF